MSKALLLAAAGSGGLVGGVIGALVTVSVVRKPSATPSAAPEAREAPEAPSPAITARLSAVENSLRALELRRALVERAPTPSSSGSAAPNRGSALVDDPVFEAAVLDVVERAEQGRASERTARRDERRKAQLERWAGEISRELGLTPAQREKVVEIRQQLASAVRQRLEGNGGAELSRRERRAHVEAIRTEAEQKLRAVLDGRQMQAYDALDSELKIGRGAR